MAGVVRAWRQCSVVAAWCKAAVWWLGGVVVKGSRQKVRSTRSAAVAVGVPVGEQKEVQVGAVVV